MIEVATPVVAGVVSICLVFLPLLTLQGLEGKLFGPVALTIVFALAASLLLAMTMVPVFCSLLLREHAHAEPWLMRQIERGYRPLLDFALAHGRWLIVVAGAALALGVLAYLGTGKTFMPTMDEGDLLIQLVKRPSVSLAASRDQDLAIERAIRAPNIGELFTPVTQSVTIIGLAGALGSGDPCDVTGAYRKGANAAQVRALSPASTLDRGYAVVQRADGLVVRDPADVAVDDEIAVRVARGRFVARVGNPGV